MYGSWNPIRVRNLAPSLDFASSTYIEVPHPAPVRNRFHNHVPNASMTDLTAVLPAFSTQPYVRLLRSLETNHVTTADLISQDCVEIAKRAQLPLLEVKRLSADILDALQTTLGIKDAGSGAAPNNWLRKSGEEVLKSWGSISTLDDELDLALGGGIPVGYVTEVVGER